MRIIVTKLGNSMVNELSDEIYKEYYENTNTMKVQNIQSYEAQIKPLHYNNNNNKNNQNKNKINNTINSNSTSNNININNSQLNETFFLTNINNNNNNEFPKTSRELESSKNLNKINRPDSNFSSNYKLINKPDFYSKLNNSIQSKDKNKRNKKVRYAQSLDLSSANAEDILNISKSIIVKQKKLHLPKDLADKYNEDLSFGYMLPDLNQNILANSNSNRTKKQDANYNNYNFNNNKFNSISSNNQYYRKISNFSRYTKSPAIEDSSSFREIIRQSAKAELAQRLKAADSARKRLTENDFRSDFLEASRYQKLQSLMDSRVLKPSDKSLIKYINQKERISDLFLEKLKECSEEKRLRANKVCQIIFNRNEKEISARKRQVVKMLEQKENEEAQQKVYLERMQKCLEDSAVILKDYENNNDVNKNKKKINFKSGKTNEGSDLILGRKSKNENQNNYGRNSDFSNKNVLGNFNIAEKVRRILKRKDYD